MKNHSNKASIVSNPSPGGTEAQESQPDDYLLTIQNTLLFRGEFDSPPPPP